MYGILIFLLLIGFVVWFITDKSKDHNNAGLIVGIILIVLALWSAVSGIINDEGWNQVIGFLFGIILVIPGIILTSIAVIRKRKIGT